jgi:hypothetical protein
MAKMTKAQATLEGKAAGETTFDGLVARGEFTVDAATEPTREEAVLRASVYTSLAGIRNDTFFDAFVGAFRARWCAAHGQLPSVQAARRVEWLRRTIDSNLRSAKDTLDKFAADFAENPLYAFEWGGAAVEAAARRDVALIMQRTLDGVDMKPEYAGYDNAIKYATEQALRGARSPHHSTSMLSNYANECKVAAWAEYAVR